MVYGMNRRDDHHRPSDNRGMRYYVAIGGNVGDTTAIFESAIAELEANCCPVRAQSEWLKTEPVLHPEQPVFGQRSFLNGALLIESALEPAAFLDLLLSIENKFGRIRGQDIGLWGPRTLDLDIVAAGQSVIQTDRLTIPHPEMHKREFVLGPLSEIAPNWIHPLLQRDTAALLDALRGRVSANRAAQDESTICAATAE